MRTAVVFLTGVLVLVGGAPAELAAEGPPEGGKKVRLALDPGKLHFFEREGE